MHRESSAPTGRAKTARCSALGSGRSFLQALKGRYKSSYFALSGLSGRDIGFSSALRLAFTFRPVGAGRA